MMKSLRFLAAGIPVAGLLFLTWAMTALSAFGQCRELVWSDEFDYTGLPDSTKWSFEEGGSGWGNNELEYYTTKRLENAAVADGKLTINARLESWNGSAYTSARMVTKQKGDFLYGRIEVRAKLPQGRGTWPAIWMMPTDGEYGGWPNSGEIDIMEHVGYDPNNIHATVHTGYYFGANGKGSNYFVTDAFNTYHVYAVEWTPAKMDFYVDSHLYFTYNYNSDYKAWPFNKRFFLIMNIAVGGNWGGAQGVDNAVFPARMDVDYVRVYQGSENMKIKGTDEIFMGETGTRYFIESEEGRTYDWTVPEGAAIVEGQGTNEIRVDWGCGGGQVSCNLGTACDSYDLTMDVTTKDYQVNGPFFITDNQEGIQLTLPGTEGSTLTWIVPEDATLVSGQGNDTLVLNWGTGMDSVKATVENTCGTYQVSRILRHLGQYAYPNPDNPYTVPCVISPDNYDYGGEGVAYHDATAGNSGTGPRANESVDTEYSGSGVDVGWVDANEWLEYTIKVPVAATYHFSMLFASANANGGGPAKIIVNGVTKLTLYPPSTGSWSVFLPSNFKDLPLAITDTLLRIETGSGGFNIGNMSILSQLPTAIVDHEAGKLEVYPVPATTELHVVCPEGAHSVTVSDLTGKVVYSLRREVPRNGELVIPMEKLPAGMYIISLTDAKNNISTQKIVK